MKNNLLILAGLIIALSYCGLKSDKQWAMDAAAKMCDKAAECADEMLKKVPKAMRKKVAKQMPTKEKCLAEANKDIDSEEEISLTAAEKEAIKTCVDAMSEISCKKMMKGGPPKACKKVTKIFKKKKRKK